MRKGLLPVLYEDNNFLVHYGILGQKWGVRRFQNSDGSLTKAGKERYGVSDKSFKNAVGSVKRIASNRIDPVKKQPIDARLVAERGGLTAKEAKDCAAIANDLYDKARMVEPRMTKDVVSSVASSGGTMYGLDYRMKQPTSIAAKIGQDAKKSGSSFESAAESLNDVVRYTTVSDDKDFVSHYDSVKKKLDGKGYAEVKCKNYFKQFEEGKVKHKAVQSVFEDLEGNRFELQFQTPESQAVKNMKLPLYEEIRKSETSDLRRDELSKQMENLAKKIHNPDGVMAIQERP